MSDGIYYPGRVPRYIEPLDVPDDEGSIEAQECLALYLGIWERHVEGALLLDFIDLADVGSQELEYQHRAYALLLRPSTSTNGESYERVGCLSLDILKSALFNGKTWHTRRVTII